MHVLVAWDDPAEAELIALYLGAGDQNAVHVTTDAADFLARLRGDENWDIVLMTTSTADDDAPFDVFQEVRKARPECPIVGACRSQDVYRQARFISNGMRSYMLRDIGGDFVFLLQSTLESTLAANRAEREQRMAERMREEIESVRRFQESILPLQLNAPPGYALAACYEPSQIRMVGGQPVILAGGDYYDVIDLDRKHTALILGDAAGHGMRACMSIMTLQTLMHMIHNRKYRRPAALVEEVNRRFCEHHVSKREGSLITLLYGLLRIHRHEFHWTSAGHPVPLLQNLATGTIEALSSGEVFGTPLGVDDTIRYRAFSAKIPPQSRLLLYSDGLVEAYAENDQSQLFGVEGVMETLRNSTRLSVHETLQALLEASHAFTKGAGRHDDTSAILLERK